MHIKRIKLLKIFCLTFNLKYGIIYIEGKRDTIPTYRLECRTVKRKLNKKYLVEFIINVIGWLILIWIVASVIDTDLHNTTIPNPIYADWNIFNILF